MRIGKIKQKIAAPKEKIATNTPANATINQHQKVVKLRAGVADAAMNSIREPDLVRQRWRKTLPRWCSEKAVFSYALEKDDLQKELDLLRNRGETDLFKKEIEQLEALEKSQLFLLQNQIDDIFSLYREYSIPDLEEKLTLKGFVPNADDQAKIIMFLSAYKNLRRKYLTSHDDIVALADRANAYANGKQFKATWLNPTAVQMTAMNQAYTKLRNLIDGNEALVGLRPYLMRRSTTELIVDE